MRAVTRSPRSIAARGSRSGATLVEVLMSLMVMGIGIVSVVTMFPIAALRSIQATQLTNAKMLRKNVEESLRMPFQTSLTNAPTTFDLLNCSITAYSNTAPNESLFQGTWQPNTAYRLGEIVLPSRKKGDRRPELERWFVVTTAGTSGTIEPKWIAGTTAVATDVLDGSVTWRAENTAYLLANGSVPNGYVQLIQASNITDLTKAYYYDALSYVVDPLGWQMLRTGDDLKTSETSANDFGFKVVNGQGEQVAITDYSTTALQVRNRRLLRINGGMHSLTAAGTGLALAENVAYHPDSWNQEVSETLPTVPSGGATSATFRTGLDLGTDFAGRRIVLTNEDGTKAIVRLLTGVAGQTVSWTEPLPPLALFSADGPARIERFDKRFSWLATVNRNVKGWAKVTVAVFFKRRFSAADEHAYDANYDYSSFTGGVSPDQVQISWTATNPDPLLKEGNYLMDGYNALWYRIVAVSAGSGTAILTLDRAIPTNLRNQSGRAILMRGIVELFEL